MSAYYVIIAYDIPSDRRRTRLAKKLKGYGERRQWSVFEARLSRNQFVMLRRDIQELIDPDEDVVAIYFLSPEALKRTVRIGNVELKPAEEPDFV